MHDVTHHITNPRTWLIERFGLEDGMSQTWHYEWCPACGVTGQVLERTVIEDAVTITSARCEACEGTGQVKIPNGFQLLPLPQEHGTLNSLMETGRTG